jgi:hypothetical protein
VGELECGTLSVNVVVENIILYNEICLNFILLYKIAFPITNNKDDLHSL